MSCFPCFMSDRKHPRGLKAGLKVPYLRLRPQDLSRLTTRRRLTFITGNIEAQIFTFRELAAATNNFMPECLIGEGGYGRVYRELEGSGQVVAVKQLGRNGIQGNKQFLVEVLMLSLLHHPNLVNLIGYCADGNQRLLVYEFFANGIARGSSSW